MSNEQDVYNGKEIAFYEATVTAWYTTRFEKDKHLLSLSSAAIAVLVTLITAVGVKSPYTGVMYSLAVFSFLICILTVLSVFGRNAKYLESVVQGSDKNDPALAIMDKISKTSFILGIVFTLLVGLFSGIDDLNRQENEMSKGKTEQLVNQNTTVVKKSVDGAPSMRPAKPQTTTSSSDSKPAQPTEKK